MQKYIYDMKKVENTYCCCCYKCVAVFSRNIVFFIIMICKFRVVELKEIII